MSRFYYGHDDFSAREILMKFGPPCYNADIDSLQYGYDSEGDVIFHCLLEFKHPCLKELTIDTIKVPRAAAQKLGVPLFVVIYFTKPAPADGSTCPPGDGYGTAEQPAMFYVVPGNNRAWKTLHDYGNMDLWFTPLRLARFMHWIRGSNASYHDLLAQGLTDDERKYKLSTKIDIKGLVEAFRFEAA